MQEIKKNGYQVIRFESIDSTNLEAKRRILGGNRQTALYIAEAQTNGKGRLGRSFYSPENNGVYMTLAYYTDYPLSDAVSITCSASVAVRNAIFKHTHKDTRIKWVNDLYYLGKKVCGILCEAIPDPLGGGGFFVIVGIGINLKKGTFPEQLQAIAGSLDTDCDKELLIEDIVKNLLYYAKNPDDRSYMCDYRENSMVLNKDVVCTRGDLQFCGHVIDITDSGALIVLRDNGEEILLDSGEVSLRLM